MAKHNRVEKEITPPEPTDWNNPRSRASLVFRASIDELGKAHPSHKQSLDKARDFFQSKLQAAKGLLEKFNSVEDFFKWRDYVKENPPDADVLGYLLTVVQSHRQAVAARNPRPKTNPTHKSIVIEAMRDWRRDKTRTLSTFIEAASIDSIEGLTITKVRMGGLDRYEIDCEALSEIKTVSLETLKTWYKNTIYWVS